MRTPRSIPRNNGISLLGISLWIVYNDDLPELNTKYSKLLLVIYSTPSPHHAMPRKTMPSYTSKTRLTRLFTRLRQVSTSWTGGILRPKKVLLCIVYSQFKIIQNKLSPPKWAFSIRKPHLTTLSCPRKPDTHQTQNLSQILHFSPLLPFKAHQPLMVQWIQSKSLHVKHGGFFPPFSCCHLLNEKNSTLPAHHFHHISSFPHLDRI